MRNSNSNNQVALKEAFNQLSKLIDLHNDDYKAKYVAEYILLLGNSIEEEIRRIPPVSSKYDQGTLVLVDFGVNIGKETSGKHFAIIVNSNDSSHLHNITVVPLSSKGKNFYVDIGTEVFDRSLEHIIAISDECQRQSEIIDKIYLPFLDLDKLDIVAPYEANVIEDSFTAALLNFCERPISVQEFKMLPEKERYAISGKAADRLVATIEFFKDSVTKFVDVFDVYKKYQKHSFADVRQITTISKKRIVPRINSFDPMGTVKVSDLVLNEVLKEIDRYLWGSYSDKSR